MKETAQLAISQLTTRKASMDCLEGQHNCGKKLYELKLKQEIKKMPHYL